MPRFFARGAPRREAVRVGELERHVHVLGELAAVVDEGEPGAERHRFGRDRVAPAQLGRIDADVVGREIDHALDHVGRLGAPVAAVGPHRIGVGEHRRDIGVDRRRAINAGDRADVHHEGGRRHLQVGAHVGDGLDPQAEERAVAVERELGLRDIIARLGVAQERLGAGAGPFHRAPDELGAEQHQRDLVVDRGLHAEAAADVAGDHPHLGFRHLEYALGELGAERVGALQRGVDGVTAVGGVVVPDRAARLHGDGGDAVDDEMLAHHVGGARERGVGRGLVAVDLDEADVVLAIVVDARRAGRRGQCRRHHGGQRLVVDHDALGGVGRLVRGLRHHEGDAVADPAHPVGHQRRIARAIHRAAVAPLEAARHRQVAPPRGPPVGAGQHREHAGRGLGRRHVDRADFRMGMGRAQHMAERHAGQRDVVDVAAAATHQAWVLEAGHRLTNSELVHRPTPSAILTHAPRRAGGMLVAGRYRVQEPSGLPVPAGAQ